MQAPHHKNVEGSAATTRTRGLAARRRRVAAMAATLGVLALALAGCRGLLIPDPPAELQAAATELADAAASLTGVAEATGEVHAVDAKDKPGLWYSILQVQAQHADDLLSVSTALTDVIRSAHSDFQRVDLQLTVPGDEQRSEVLVRNANGMLLDAADTARQWRDVEIVEFGSALEDDLYIKVNGAPTAGMVQLARDEVIAVAPVPIGIIFSWENDGRQGSVTVTATAPEAKLADALEEIRALPDVQYLNYSRRASSGNSLIITAKDIERVEKVLENMTAAPGEIACTSFFIHNDVSEVQGKVGACE